MEFHRLFWQSCLAVLWVTGIASSSFQKEASYSVHSQDLHENLVLSLKQAHVRNRRQVPPPTQNITYTDNHDYYSSHVVTNPSEAMGHWVKMEDYDKSVKHGHLSDAFRTASVVPLRFTFPYYGHEVSWVAVATGGFLYVGQFLHQWLTATQYIAPLMANFGTDSDTAAEILYLNMETETTIEWRKVKLRDEPESGPFDFQVTLKKSGEITFVYKWVPVNVTAISSKKHPVKIGLADGYYNDTITGGVRSRSIWNYHRVEVNTTYVHSNSAIVFTPLATCLDFKDCMSCVTGLSAFNCKWCEHLGRCGSGIDRGWQQWWEHGCDAEGNYTSGTCPAPPISTPAPTPMPQGCSEFTSCKSCVSHDYFNDCNWCDALQECSSMVHLTNNNHWRSWVNAGCFNEANWTRSQCLPPRPPPTTTTTSTTTTKRTTTPSPPTTVKTTTHQTATIKPPTSKTTKRTTTTTQSTPPPSTSGPSVPPANAQPPSQRQTDTSSSSNGVKAGGIVAIILLVVVVVAVVGWVLFAYFNPESRSGQFMIRNRPSELWNRFKNWRRGNPEERYAPGTNNVTNA